MYAFYQERGLDTFKDAISAPGLSLKYLMNTTDAKFSLFEEKDADLYDIMHKCMVGGPSIVFKRYAEANKTFIRGLNKMCKKNIGMDANALYLYTMDLEMPVGKYTRVESYDIEQLNKIY